jgi:hypothetical protein
MGSEKDWSLVDGPQSRRVLASDQHDRRDIEKRGFGKTAEAQAQNAALYTAI